MKEFQSGDIIRVVAQGDRLFLVLLRNEGAKLKAKAEDSYPELVPTEGLFELVPDDELPVDSRPPDLPVLTG